jgi:hypothetical protein
MATKIAFKGEGRDHGPRDQIVMQKGGKHATPLTKGDVLEVKGASLNINVNAENMVTANTAVQKIKSENPLENETQLMGPVPQADRAKSARPQGAVRTTGGVGEVTLPAVEVVGRALRESDRQHVLAAQGGGRALGDSPTVRAPAENTRQVKESIQLMTRVKRSEMDMDIGENNATKIGIMQ